MARTVEKTLAKHARILDQRQQIPAADLRSLHSLHRVGADNFVAQSLTETESGNPAPKHLAELQAMHRNERIEGQHRAERRGRVAGFVKRAIAVAALAGVAAGGGLKIAQSVEHSHQVSATHFAADQKKIASGIREAMVTEDKAVLKAAKANPGSYLAGPASDKPGVYEVMYMGSDGPRVNEDVYMGMTDGQPDPNKPMYATITDYEDGDNIKSGGEMELVAPAGDAIANDQGAFSGHVTGWAARAAAGTTASDPNFIGGYTYDTTDPSQAAGYGQPTPSVPSVANNALEQWNNEVNI